jgi:ribosomal protein L11 methyltransferase
MSWSEIIIEVKRQHAEALSDALLEAGALSVSVEDADEGTAAEQALFGEPGMEPEEAAWEHSRIVAMVEAERDEEALIQTALEISGLQIETLSFHSRPVAEQDWVRLTQSQFEPIHIGTNIWVVPSWHQAPDPDGLVLELDPGLAFGTGSHPTTRLCMEWLEANMPAGASVLDYGCGSGILALVAKKCGAREVIGVDIDHQAIEAARHNAGRNHCDIDFMLPEEFSRNHPGHCFDIVVANILANPLTLMAPLLGARVAPGGILLLSGILARQSPEIAAAYTPFCALSVWKESEGWVAMAGKLRADRNAASKAAAL